MNKALLLLIILLAVPAQAQQASRIQRADNDSVILRTENEITSTVTLPGIQFIPCQAKISLGYYQRNTLARVEASIENKSCVAGNGSFEIIATIRDDNDDTASLIFPEQWQQDGMETMTLVRDYPIGENVDLVRVRSSKVTCECQQGAED